MTVTFNQLNTDVKLEILESLHATSKQSLLNVSLCSKSLYDMSINLIFRIISILFTWKRSETNGRLIRQLLTDSKLSTKVRKIRILWAPSSQLQHGEASKQDLELLGEALPQLTGLKTFVWDAQYPILQWLLDTIHIHVPRCNLYVRMPPQRSHYSLLRLHNSPCLYSLHVEISRDDIYAFSRLSEVVSSNTQLKHLAILCEQNNDVVNSERSPLLFPPLELRSLELEGPMDISLLYPSVVWPKLERLSCTDIFFLPDLKSQLTGLTTLRLRVSRVEDKEGLWEFLRENCHRLQTLDLTGCTAAINRSGAQIWAHLGRTLISLRIHEDEFSSRLPRRPMLSCLQLEHLAINCQRVRSLGLDLECSIGPFSNSQPNPPGSEKIPQDCQMLEQVADLFWFLEHLELNLEINIADQGKFANRKATMEGAREMWKDLWQQMERSRVRKSHEVTIPRLRSLDVVGGSYRPISDISFSHWEAAAQQRFHISLSERADEAWKGIATVNCVELSALQAKLGSCEPFKNDYQKNLMDAVKERADTGPFARQLLSVLMDREMMRASSFWDSHDEHRFYYR